MMISESVTMSMSVTMSVSRDVCYCYCTSVLHVLHVHLHRRGCIMLCLLSLHVLASNSSVVDERGYNFCENNYSAVFWGAHRRLKTVLASFGTPWRSEFGAVSRHLTGAPAPGTHLRPPTMLGLSRRCRIICAVTIARFVGLRVVLWRKLHVQYDLYSEKHVHSTIAVHLFRLWIENLIDNYYDPKGFDFSNNTLMR